MTGENIVVNILFDFILNLISSPEKPEWPKIKTEPERRLHSPLIGFDWTDLKCSSDILKSNFKSANPSPTFYLYFLIIQRVEVLKQYGHSLQLVTDFIVHSALKQEPGPS